MSSAQKLEAEGYKVVEIKQHSSVLHPPTKLLEELILNRRFHYTENKLLEINFQNAKCQYDTNLNRYITKKKSSGKVDMVVSLINAMYLLNLEVMLNNDMDWSVQVL
jgi:phage terminase large subunit-like protein